MKKIIFMCFLITTFCSAKEITIRPSNADEIPLDADIIFKNTRGEGLSVGVLLSPKSRVLPQHINLEKTAVLISRKKFALPANYAGKKSPIWLTPLPEDYYTDIANAQALVLLITTNSGKKIKMGFNYNELDQIKEVITDKKPTKWYSYTEKSAITDKPIAYAVLTASNTIPGTLGTPVTPRLVVRCQNSETTVFVNFQRFITTEKSQVTTRVNSRTAKTSTWVMSTDHKAAFSPRALDFARTLSSSDKLLVKTTPHGDNPVTALFDTTGAKKALRDIRRLCVW